MSIRSSMLSLVSYTGQSVLSISILKGASSGSSPRRFSASRAVVAFRD